MRYVKIFAWIGAIALLLCGCTAFMSDPVASIEVVGFPPDENGVVHIDQPGEITFDGSGSYPTDRSQIAEYHWEFERVGGDDPSSEEQGPLVELNLDEGTYLVKLFVKTTFGLVNCGGCSTLIVEVLAPVPCPTPEIDFRISDDLEPGMNQFEINVGFGIDGSVYEAVIQHLSGDDDDVVVTHEELVASDGNFSVWLDEDETYRITVTVTNQCGNTGYVAETYTPEGEDPVPTCVNPVIDWIKLDGNYLLGTPEVKSGTHEVTAQGSDGDDCVSCGEESSPNGISSICIKVKLNGSVIYNEPGGSILIDVEPGTYTVEVTVTDDDCPQNSAMESRQFIVLEPEPECTEPVVAIIIPGPEDVLKVGERTLEIAASNGCCPDSHAPEGLDGLYGELTSPDGGEYFISREDILPNGEIDVLFDQAGLYELEFTAIYCCGGVERKATASRSFMVVASEPDPEPDPECTEPIAAIHLSESEDVHRLGKYTVQLTASDGCCSSGFYLNNLSLVVLEVDTPSGEQLTFLPNTGPEGISSGGEVDLEVNQVGLWSLRFTVAYCCGGVRREAIASCSFTAVARGP